MKAKINRDNAPDFVNRFLHGETNAKEEQALYRFYRQHAHLPEELEGYRTMFAWYEAGMPGEPEDFIRSYVHPKRMPWLRKLYISSGAAAAVALLLTVGLMTFHRNRNTSFLPSQYACYKDSYVMEDGKRVTVSTDELIQIIEATNKKLRDTENYAQQKQEQIEHYLNYDPVEEKVKNLDDPAIRTLFTD